MSGEPDARNEFLLKMYDQMCNEISRSLVSVWQVLAAMVGTFVVYLQYTKYPFQTDISTCIVLIISWWIIAHIIDSNYWYNRNNAIITNIERQFLHAEDLRTVHYYFGKHRDGRAVLTNFKIQLCAVIGISLFVLFYHFDTRLFNILSNNVWRNPEYWADKKRLCIVFPYLLVIIETVILVMLKKQRNKDYKEFIDNSPGLLINTESIIYGKGHPTHPTA